MRTGRCLGKLRVWGSLEIAKLSKLIEAYAKELQDE